MSTTITFINLTSKPIHELSTGLKLQPASKPLEATPLTTVTKVVNGVTIYSTSFKPIKSLPPALPNTIYIVSALVLNSIPTTRADFVSPGNVVRIDNRVVGCKGFRCR